MMKKRRRTAALSLALFLTTAGITGCRPEPGQNFVFEDAQEDALPKTRLTFFGFKYEAINVMAIEDSLHGFMDQYPDLSISYDSIKSREYFEVLEKRLSIGNGDDIFMVDHARALELGRQGKLADLSDLSTLDSFSPLAKSQMSAQGTIDYFPTSISAFGLYCNLDFLKKHGQKIPQNMAEFESVCNYFVSQGITPIVANNDISLKTIAIAKSMYPLYASGDSAAELAQFNSGEEDLAEALRPGFQLVEQMLESGWIDRAEALSTAKTKDDLILFAEGRHPFMLTGAWAVARFRELKPEFNFEVCPYPILEDGGVLVINVDTRISVNADSPHLKEAKQFVEYLTQPDPLWEFVNSQSSFSPLMENRLAEDKAVQSIGPYLTNGRSVIGSDDNLIFPIWDMTRQCVVGMMEGDDSDDAVARMRSLIDDWTRQQ